MEYLIIVFILLLILTNTKSIIRYLNAKKYLAKNQKIQIDSNIKEKICVIIPAYHEVKNIKKSIEYFKNMSNLCDVYYVTTSKEKDMATYNEIKAQIRKQNTQNIFLENCPNIEGTMANQLNFMAKRLPKDCIIAIYNIDSFPEIRTFKYVIDNIQEDIVYQQVSYFDDNNKGVLKSAQNWQNRWSIVYEMGKYITNTNNSFIYTIGHGLFLRKNILDKCGYWSEEEINEDNEFGYRLLCNNVRIKPIPFLEQASFANNLSIYIKQQSTWVNGPLYAFTYFKKTSRKSFKSFWLALLNFKAFISWTFFPILFLAFAITSVFYSFIYTIIIFILMTVYLSMLNYLVTKLLMNLKYINNKKNFINIFNDYAFFIIHCFGAFITISKIIRGKNTKQNKYNTEK